jgi:glucose/arabinose dehydrogenase
VSEGRHYSGLDIPDHDTRTEFAAPTLSWTPVISPASLVFLRGREFPEWRGDALISSLSGQSIVRVEVDGETAREAERFGMDRRIRAVREGIDGALWVLEDGSGRTGGRLLRLTARN